MYASVYSAKCLLSLDFILCSNPCLPGALEGMPRASHFSAVALVVPLPSA